MELDELNVGDSGACAKSASHAISRGDIRVGGVFKDAAEPAGSKQHSPCFHQHRRARTLIECGNARGALVAQQQIRYGGEAVKLDVFRSGGSMAQCAHNFVARGIAMRMQDAIAAVSALARKQQV